MVSKSQQVLAFEVENQRAGGGAESYLPHSISACPRASSGLIMRARAMGNGEDKGTERMGLQTVDCALSDSPSLFSVLYVFWRCGSIAHTIYFF